MLAGPRFVDRAPAEVVATLLDEGHYLCSERTMYRILAADQPVRERRNQREHPQYTKPELVATASNQTWSWDITKLLGPTKWTYFYLYVVLDIFSRYAVGWMVADRENSALAGRLIEETCHKQGVQPQVLTLHSDRGAPMTSKCTAQLLADLGVTRSLSRPQVSRRQPLLRGPVQDPEVPPRLPWPLPRHHRRDRLLPNVLPLVQHRTSPWRDRDAHPGRRASQSNPERAGAARADPSSRLDPSSRTLRSRDPTTGSPSPSRLDQPTCDAHNRRNCSVNRNRHCLKVVDRFRRKLKLAPVKGVRKREIARGAKHWLAPRGGCDGRPGLLGRTRRDRLQPIRQSAPGRAEQAARMAPFKWVNTTLGNIKCAITGTYRKLGPDHAGRYLASFAWRYNRRYQLETMIPRFVHSAARTEPMPYRLAHRRMTFRDKQERVWCNRRVVGWSMANHLRTRLGLMPSTWLSGNGSLTA